MAEEFEKIILGDTAISSVEGSPGKFSRRRKNRKPRLTQCENCGEPLHGHWCAKCGQPAVDYRRSFRYVILDVLDSFLDWDTKFFGTVAWLVVRPWKLTNDFLAGHRVRYVHPLRLYFLASILFFFVINYWAKGFHFDASKLSEKDRAEAIADISNDPDVPPEIREKILHAFNPSPSPAPSAAAASTESAASPAAAVSPTPALAEVPDLQSLPPDARAKVEKALKLAAKASASPEGKKHSAKPGDDDFVVFDGGPGHKSTATEKWWQDRAREKLGEHGSNLQLFLRGMINNLPYMVLCCIPLFALVLKTLYVFRRIHYLDHLVYALHIHTFAYVGVMLIALVTIGLHRVAHPILAGWLIGLLWAAFAMEILLSIRRVYRQGWFFSILKFLVGGLVYLIVLVVALAATFLITLVLPS